MATSTPNINLIEDLIFDVQQAAATTDDYLNIIEFVDQEIDKDAWGIDLNLNQRSILKAYYKLSLTIEEHSFLEYLKHEGDGRTTWDFNQDVLPQYLVLDVGRRGSKCQNYNNLVLTKLGWRYLHEISPVKMPSQTSYAVTKTGLQPLNSDTNKLDRDTWHDLQETVAIEGLQKTAQADKFYVKGLSATKKVKTACGYEIEATPEHRIKVLGIDGKIQWKYFNELVVGDYACIHRSTNLFPSNYIDSSKFIPTEANYSNGLNCKKHEYPQEVTPSVGRLLGLLVGDGSWTKPSALQLSLHEQDLDFYKAVLEENGLLKDVSQSFDRRSKHGFRLTIYSTILRSFFDRLGFSLTCQADDKKVPWSIRQSPKDVQAAFISYLFAADGSLGKGGRDVSLSTASKFLAQEIQLMLLNFGIVSRLAIRQVKGKDYYLVILRGKRSLEIFARDITFGLPRKQDPLVAYLASTNKDGGDTERIPYQKAWLQKIRSSLPIAIQPASLANLTSSKNKDINSLSKVEDLRVQFRKIVGNSIKEGSSELLSSYRLNSIIDFAQKYSPDREAVNHFKYIQDCNYFYDPIVSIEDTESFCVDLSVPECEQYVAQGFTNHNSSLASIIVCYEFYKLCHIPKPQKHYGVGGNTPITILVLSTTHDQAKDTIYAQIVGMFKYIKYFKPLISKKLITVGATDIEYKSKQLNIICGNSRTSSQVGYSVILLLMDEFARIEGTSDAEGEVPSALGMWDNLGASGISFAQDARRIALSSAWYEGDAIDKLYQVAQKDPTYLAFRLATWQLNPKYDRNNPIVASDYNKDPRKAALEYEGLRTSDTQGFFDGSEVVASFTGDTYINTHFEKPECREKVEIDNVVKACTLSCGYLDPAITKDSYTFAFGRKELNQKGLLMFYVDGVLVWEPSADRKVSIVHVQECIKQVHSARPILALGADHHNSAETVERLNLAGIRSKVYTATNQMQVSQYTFTRELMHQGRLVLPRSSPWRNKLQDELCRVLLIKGTKIDHSRGFSKDISDAVCGLCWLLERTQLTSGSAQVQVVSQIPAHVKQVQMKGVQGFAKGRADYFKQKRF